MCVAGRGGMGWVVGEGDSALRAKEKAFMDTEIALGKMGVGGRDAGRARPSSAPRSPLLLPPPLPKRLRRLDTQSQQRAGAQFQDPRSLRPAPSGAERPDYESRAGHRSPLRPHPSSDPAPASSSAPCLWLRPLPLPSTSGWRKPGSGLLAWVGFASHVPFFCLCGNSHGATAASSLSFSRTGPGCGQGWAGAQGTSIASPLPANEALLPAED